MAREGGREGKPGGGAGWRTRCGEENNKTRKLLFGVQHVGKKSKSNGLFK